MSNLESAFICSDFLDPWKSQERGGKSPITHLLSLLSREVL